MSRTRALIADLRRRLGLADPLSAPPEPPTIAVAPARVYPPRARATTPGPFATKAAQHTTALVGIGHVGTRYATDVVLQFQAELAVAHEAVATELPPEWGEQHGLLPLQSRVTDHREFLLRPDLGRRLSADSLNRLRELAVRGVDVQLILADGLSAVACMASGMELLAQLTTQCERRGWRLGTPVLAKFARVWLQDEIGEQVDARVSVILLGERPGLGTGDGLSAYLVHAPRVGNTDSDRNMMSNIHARGTPPDKAAARIAMLIDAMLNQQTSGVTLDLSRAAELAEAAGTGYRAPQVRDRLVEV